MRAHIQKWKFEVQRLMRHCETDSADFLPGEPNTARKHDGSNYLLSLFNTTLLSPSQSDRDRLLDCTLSGLHMDSQH